VVDTFNKFVCKDYFEIQIIVLCRHETSGFIPDVFSLFREARRAMKELLGSSVISKVGFRDNYIIIGKQGLPTGSAIEAVSSSAFEFRKCLTQKFVLSRKLWVPVRTSCLSFIAKIRIRYGSWALLKVNRTLYYRDWASEWVRFNVPPET